MIEDFDSSRKNAAYKYFVGELAKCASRSVEADRIRKNGHPERTNDADLPLNEVEEKRRALFLRLAPEDREILAKFVEKTRVGALHDVASLLEDWLALDEIKISLHGYSVPASPYNMMHADLLSLVAGEPWEDEE